MAHHHHQHSSHPGDHTGRGAFAAREALVHIVPPMGVGSVVGAVSGGMLVGVVPASALKIAHSSGFSGGVRHSSSKAS
jgi:hypothetical protein